MRSPLTAGSLAGIIAGLAFGLMMQVMKAPSPADGQVPMMMLVARVLRSDSLAAGWFYHLFNSAVIGGLFGLLFGDRVGRIGRASTLGALYGTLWWVLGGLVLMPVLLGMPAFSPLTMAMMRPVALGSFLGHLLFGALLGAGTSVLLRSGEPAHPEPGTRSRRW
jgi:hypothetical protein